MLIRTLFVLLLFATLAETIVHGSHALAQATLHRRALTGLRAEIAQATTAAARAVAAAIEAGGDPRALAPAAPTPQATCLLAAGDSCAVMGSATIAFQTPAASPSPCPGTVCTIYDQNNDAVEEGRIGATIAAQAIASTGAVLAARNASVTFRTLLVPPYAALAGSADDSVGMLGARGNGDDGGTEATGGSAGTRIDVLYQNEVTGQTMPANVWRPQIQPGGSTPQAWSP